MSVLEECDELLESLAEEIEPHLLLYRDSMERMVRGEKPLSTFSMTSFFPKIESIRIGIFSVLEREEFYSSNILLRSLIEHLVKAQYLFFKTIKSDDDEIGIDYWLFGQDQERLDYAKALEASYSLIGVRSEVSPLETLKGMGVIDSDKSATQIRKRTEQFQYKNMTHYIADKLGTKDSGEAPFLTSIFPKYAQLSSSVHGGPASVFDGEGCEEAATEAVNIATFSTLYIRWLSLVLIYQTDQSVGPLLNLASKYLHQFTRHTK